MRLLDFFVFYEATMYKSKEEENKTGNQRLGKATNIAALIITLWILTILELIITIVFKSNFINFKVLFVGLFVLGCLMMYMFDYIYVRKGRWQYVISDDYHAFKMSKIVANFIIFSTLMLSVALLIAVGIALGNL